MACRILAICFAFSAMCHGDTPPAGNDPAGRNEMLYRFTPEKPSIAQALDQSVSRAGYKFIEVEVTRVVNPKLLPVIFEIHYQSGEGNRVFLGGFGLYPSDNTGKFIVGTQGKLKDGGSIILSLIVPDNHRATDTLEVTTKRITLTKGDQR